jgi:hypothetical protein
MIPQAKQSAAQLHELFANMNRRGWLLILFLLATSFGCQKRQPSEFSDSDTTPPATRLEHSAGIASGDASKRSNSIRTLAKFSDEAKMCGLDFTYQNDEQKGHYAIVEIVGGGIGLIDFDLDGYLDVLIPGGGTFASDPPDTKPLSTMHRVNSFGSDELDAVKTFVSHREKQTVEPRLTGRPTGLFRHLGARHYASVAEQAGLTEQPYYSHGIAAADVDQDGFPDLLITGYGGVVLWQNQGDGTFRNITASSRLEPGGWSTSAAWGDINQDGWLDLYVAHYLDWSFDNNPICVNERGQRDVCGPKRLGPVSDRFLLGEPTGEFRDVTAAYQIRTDGKGLGVVIGDIDLDGDSDIYVANDTTQNFLYRNDGPSKLVEAGLINGCGFDPSGAPDGSMGTDLADYNGDGWPDLWVVNFEQETFALYRNIGDGTFLHASEATGMAAEAGLYVGWGTHFFDFDRDADLDVFVSNGAPFQYPVNTTRKQLPLLFENHQQRRFTNVARLAGRYTGEPHDGRGVAVGDLENRGAIDVVVSHLNAPVALLRNETAPSGHWIGFQLVGHSGPRHAVGALVEIEAAGQRQVAQLKGGGSYLSTSDRRLFFGLAAADQVDRITIRWPRGSTESFERLGAGRYWLIREGEQPRALPAGTESQSTQRVD